MRAASVFSSPGRLEDGRHDDDDRERDDGERSGRDPRAMEAGDQDPERAEQRTDAVRADEDEGSGEPECAGRPHLPACRGREQEDKEDDQRHEHRIGEQRSRPLRDLGVEHECRRGQDASTLAPPAPDGAEQREPSEPEEEDVQRDDAPAAEAELEVDPQQHDRHQLGDLLRSDLRQFRCRREVAPRVGRRGRDPGTGEPDGAGNGATERLEEDLPGRDQDGDDHTIAKLGGPTRIRHRCSSVTADPAA